MKRKLYDYLLILGDSSMILGHRLSELCGHGPTLETDIALTNISLDLFGQVRNYFQYASTLVDDVETEDDVAFLRLPHQYRNLKLVEHPNTNFAHVVMRQFLYDSYHLPLLRALSDSNDKRISAIANKSIKEVKYHFRFSSEWVKRLGGGTAVSHEKIQEALNHLYRYSQEATTPTELEQEMLDYGIGADLNIVREEFQHRVDAVLSEADLKLPEVKWPQTGGKLGKHTEHHGYILADLQYMQRAYPGMKW